MRVLIVEDNPDILATLYGFLEPKGYTLDSARNGYGGLALISENEYDAIVLDVMLPGISGIELCRKVRYEFQLNTPVLMLTARDSLADKALGFESGADDYLVKPFSVAELDMRLRAMMRRAIGAHGLDRALRFGTLVFDPELQEVTRDGIKIVLTRIGYVILRTLMLAAPRIVTRESLEHAVWGDDRPESDALRTHIHFLRQGIDKPFERPMLVTIPGVGYRLVFSDA
ncbi:response regulator transcription factor [Massilia timonae]|uniref:response regulator transcription factor n=1 Tax=Massilia timonae TaxID=47229 RepID=UPI00289936F1|nr:response regulator transcription factor [Massilia timonae]